MKRIIAFILAFAIYACASASAAPLYSSTEEEVVTGGVTLTKKQQFFGSHALNINCVTADLKNKNLSFELLKHSGGSDKTATVKDLAQKEENTVVAINGDFFSAYKGDQNFSLGIEVKDGELLQSHINTDMAAGFLSENVLSFSYLTYQGEVEAPDGTKMPIAHINKPTDYYGAVLMYTPEFNAGTSPFLPEGITAVTVTDNVVTAKGVSLGGSISIPEDGYILVIDDNMTPFLEYKFNLGDTVKTKIEFTPSIENVETAFGGGTLLLKDGKKTEITHNVAGNNPRSAIGTNEDGTVVYFITVDGRQNQSRGVSLSELADICLDLGCVNALNLDGGGSTQMVGKTLNDDSLHFINSPIENRKVINAPAIVSSAKSGDAAGAFIEAENDYVLAGDSVKLIVTPYDKNYNKPSSGTEKIKLVVSEGKGRIKDNIFYPQGNETAVIDVYLSGKKTDSCTVSVISEVSGIIAPREINLKKGESYKGEGQIKVFDKQGKTAVVRDLTLLQPRFDSNLVSLSLDGTVKAISEGASEIKLTHGNAQRSIEVICGDYEIDAEKPVTKDPLAQQSDAGFVFDIYASSKINTLFDRAAYAHNMNVLKKADASVIIGGDKPHDLTPDRLSLIRTDSYSESDIFNSKVITIKQDKGKFSRGEQWKKLAEALKSAADNIFIISDEAMGFVSDIDRKAFHSLLTEATKEKNVFVISGGEENFCRIADGVRYITVADPRQEDSISLSIKNACRLTFRITSNSITYNFRKLFE
ncbi:MAG: phosphodiester glycosidase family protein [Clostridia bacterium]|nr:phosphodiester glycosidase family protein [Clostridia bacterium]